MPTRENVQPLSFPNYSKKSDVQDLFVSVLLQMLFADSFHLCPCVPCSRCEVFPLHALKQSAHIQSPLTLFRVQLQRGHYSLQCYACIRLYEDTHSSRGSRWLLIFMNVCVFQLLYAWVLLCNTNRKFTDLLDEFVFSLINTSNACSALKKFRYFLNITTTHISFTGMWQFNAVILN